MCAPVEKIQLYGNYEQYLILQISPNYSNGINKTKVDEIVNDMWVHRDLISSTAQLNKDI